MKNSFGKWLFVLFIRAPIIAPLYLLGWIGEKAEIAGDWLEEKLPGLER